MSRFFILATWLLIDYLNVPGQVPANRNKPANPSSTTRPSEFLDTANENKLVALALKGPEFNASIHQNRINELELRRAKATWLNLLSLSANYNDQTFVRQAAQTAYVYPKYLFGVTVPLGIIFSQGSQVKTARESIANGKDQQELLARTIKANVLSKYKQYKLYTALIEMQGELMNDVSVNSAQAEENFKNGSITVEAYIGAQKIKNEEMVKLMNLQLQQDLFRIDIERLIGVPLEDVLHSKSNMSNPVPK